MLCVFSPLCRLLDFSNVISEGSSTSSLFNSMAMSPSAFSFLSQALLPSKNPKLFSQIFLIFIICNEFLYADLQVADAPLVSKMAEIAKLLPTIDPTNPEYTELLNTFMEVTKDFLIFDIVCDVFVFVISTFLAIITYYANSTTSLGEILTLKEVLNKVKGIIRGPFITQLCAVLLVFLYLILFAVICFAISWYVSINSKISIMLFLTPLILLATLLLLYFVQIWTMGVAISVIEPNVYGISAIMHATRLLKGKKKQVFLLIFSLFIASGIISAFYNTITMMFASDSKAGSFVIGFVCQLLQQVVTLYLMIAIMVLYYECNQSINGGIGDAINYTKLATSSIV